MKTHWVRVVWFFSLITSIALPAFSDELEGFRGIKWGARFEENKAEMTLLEKGRDRTYYLRKGDKLSIGEAELTRIVYGYWKGTFFSVVIDSSGAANKIALIRAFHEQFGTPNQPNRFLDQYLWDRAITTIFLECTIRDSCKASLFSRTLMEQQEEESKKAAAGARKDF